MRVGSLFSGCLGLDLGLEAAGFETAWVCENDPRCQEIIRARRPGLPIFDDVRHLDDVPPVDVLAGGFPCQDLSNAGKGKGLDGDRSGLWFAYADAIRKIRPRLVLVENVPGIFSKMGGRAGESAFGTVVADLAEAGYVGCWVRLRASDVGAPHSRDRVFVFAGGARLDQVAADSDGSAFVSAVDGEDGRMDVERGDDVDGRDLGDTGPDDGHDRQVVADASVASDSEHAGSSRAGGGPQSESPVVVPVDNRAEGETAWGIYEPAVLQWEGIFGRRAPSPTDDRGRLEPEFVEWMLGFPQGWTEGVPRTARLRMLGNAVQVQCGEVVGRLLMMGMVR